MSLSSVEVSVNNQVGPAIVQVNQGPAGIGANPMTASADMIVGGTAGEATRLAKGTAGQYLAMNSDASAVVWQSLRNQPRFQTWAQGQAVNVGVNTTYVKVPLANGTMDSSTAIGFNGPFSPGQVQYVGASGLLFNLIGTVDIENTTGSSLEVSLKLAINDVVIDATQCNATITNNGVGKLHSMWITSLNTNQEVSMWIASPEGSHTVVPVRWRFQATPLL